MKRKNRVLPILALLLIFSLAACGGKSAEPTQAPATDNAPAASQPANSDSGAKTEATSVPPTNTPEPTNTPVPPTPTPAPTNTPEPQEEMASDFARIEDVVDSYHAEGEFSYIVTTKPKADDGDLDLKMTFSSDWVKADNPYGYNTATVIKGVDLGQGTNDEETPQDIQMISIDDVTYLKINNQWMSMQRDETGDDPTMSINVDDFIANMDEVKRVGKEKVNGINAIHYQYKDTASLESILNSIMEQQLGENEDLSQFEAVDTAASGDIWIAEKGKYAVKAETNMETTFKSKDGDKEVHIIGRTLVEIKDVNGDIVIEPPEDAPQPGQTSIPGFEPGTFPMPEKTTVEGSFGGMTNLTSQLSVDEVNAFYDEELPKLGWTKKGDMMPTWSKDGKSFVLMVTSNDDNTTSILIMVNPEQ